MIPCLLKIIKNPRKIELVLLEKKQVKMMQCMIAKGKVQDINVDGGELRDFRFYWWCCWHCIW